MRKRIGIILTLSITIILIIGIILFYNLKKYNINNLTYNIVIENWSLTNGDTFGGYASIYEATLINLDKKEIYEISYQDVWDIHEKNGNKDSVSIIINKLSDDELTNIKNQYSTQDFVTLHDFLSEHIKTTNYDLKIYNKNII